MNSEVRIGRRRVIQALGLAGIAAAVTGVRARANEAPQCETDGTPMQFIPKTPKDAKPLEDELRKYPKCPYCGMDRRQWHRTRHLIHYSDDLSDGTCSLHCAALSLALNIDRVPRAIYAADYGDSKKPCALVNAEQASYLVGSKLKGTMTRTSKLCFGSKSEAEKAQKEFGGEVQNFDHALRAAYVSMAEDTRMIRKRRDERRRKMEGNKA